MVVIAAWADASITTKYNIRDCSKLATMACKEANISLQDIGLVIFSGVYRPNFRSEPSCASHIQNKLNIRCHELDLNSRHCFSFDIIDGSRGPHRAIQTVDHLLDQLGEKYALVVCSDVKPTKQSQWPYQNHALAIVLAKDGSGMKFDNGKFSSEELRSYSKSSFDHGKKVPIINYFGDSVDVQQISTETEYTSENSSLGSVQMRDFLLWSENRKGKLKHTIIDRSGSKSVTNWSA
ncbi:MAG: hypothetical protein ACKVHN_01605 [Candidatus Poseidoniales archaeon]|jgi:hypothetical protein|tara:strand:- start:4129 stop:4836 length:708 start_codon:yes stop_codon:yes gene_type:complete